MKTLDKSKEIKSEKVELVSIFPDTLKDQITKFVDIEKDLLMRKEEDLKINFQLDVNDGEKLCRSHIARLRKLKKPINDTHKLLKKDVVAYSKAVDGRKKELLSIVEGMIDRHNKPLIEIKEKEEEIRNIEEEKDKKESKCYRENQLFELGFVLSDDIFIYSPVSIKFKKDIILLKAEECFEMSSIDFEAFIMVKKLAIKNDQNSYSFEEEQEIKAKSEKHEVVEDEVRVIQNISTSLDAEVIGHDLSFPVSKHNVVPLVDENPQSSIHVCIESVNHVVFEKYLKTDGYILWGNSLNNKLEILSKEKILCKYGCLCGITNYDVSELSIINVEDLGKLLEVGVDSPSDYSVEHRRNINRLVLKGFMDVGLTENYSKRIIRAIFAGFIPNISINY